MELTPASIIENLAKISTALENQAKEVAKLDEEAVRKRHAQKMAYAKAFIEYDGTVDQRKLLAEMYTEQLSLDADLAEQVLRAGRETLRVMRDRLDVGRSLGAIMRMEWSGSQ